MNKCPVCGNEYESIERIDNGEKHYHHGNGEFCVTDFADNPKEEQKYSPKEKKG